MKYDNSEIDFIDPAEKQLAEVMDKAMETGEKIVTIECPCCHKVYYCLESEACYNPLNPESDMPTKRLGRKCPYCGVASMITSGNKREQDLEQMRVEMEAEQKAQKMLDNNKTSWADICNPKL